MSVKLSEEKIIKIRKEIRKGKTRKQIAKELNISLDSVYKYGKHIKPGIRIHNNFKNLIKKEVLSKKTKKQVAREYGLSYKTVKRITSEIKSKKYTPAEEEIQKLRRIVKDGVTKEQASRETGIPYHIVRQYTKDISFCNMIPFHLQKQIQDAWKKDKTRQDIAEEFNISYDTSVKYARQHISPYRRYTEVPEDVINSIREQVKHGKTKLQVAEELNISYAKVKRFTKDLQGGVKKRNPQLSKKAINRIRRDVQSGKPKMQVSRELKISPKLIYHYTKDIITGHPRDLGIAGNTLKFLQRIMKNGYVKPSKEFHYKNYQILRLKFPNVRRVEMYGKSIYFIQENSDLAMRVFLEDLNKKIISYQELQQIIKLFDGNMLKKDRKKYISNRE